MKQDNNISRIDKGWNRMSGMLDDHMPQRRRRRFLILWFLIGLTGLILGSQWLRPFIDGHAPVSTEDVNKPEDVALKAQEQTSDQIIPSPQKSVSSTEHKLVKKEVSPQYRDGNSSQSDVQRSSSVTSQNESKGATYNPSPSEAPISSNRNNPFAERPQLTTSKKINKSNIAADSKTLRDGSEPSADPSILLTRQHGTQAVVESPILKNPRITVSAIENKWSEPVYHSKPFSITDERLIFPELTPVLVSCCQPWRLTASANAEYLPDFESWGFGGGLMLERKVGQKVYAGVALQYMVHKLNYPESQQGRVDNLADIPEDTEVTSGAESPILYQGNPLELLRSNSTDISSLSTRISLSYRPWCPLAVTAGSGIEYYAENNSLVEAGSEFNMTQGRYYSLESGSRVVPFIEGGIRIKIQGVFKAHGSYRHALRDFYITTEGRINTDKWMAGLSMRF